MIIQKIIPSVFVLTVMAGLSGCATGAVMDVAGCHIKTGCSKSYVKKHKMLEDTYIAIGKPVKPIAGFDNALVLVGKKSTLILTPKTADDAKFFQNFHKFDLKHLSLDTRDTSIEVKDGSLSNLSSSATITFARKSDFPATANEKRLLNELGFRLASDNTSVRADGVYFEYKKWVGFNITVAQAIPNTHLQHTFKNPVSFEFVALEQKERKLQPFLKALIFQNLHIHQTKKQHTLIYSYLLFQCLLQIIKVLLKQLQ